MSPGVLVDISQPVNPRSAAFPGDQAFTCGWTARIPEGQSVNVSWIKTSPHVGTHVDAPHHFDDGAATTSDLPLDAFIGPAQVIDARGHDTLDAALFEDIDLAEAPRVLIRTQETTNPEAFLTRFPLLTPTAIDALRHAAVRTIGIDAPSYDPIDSQTLPIHHALSKAGIHNIENLRLDQAPTGRHELLAAPLAWENLDAAPLRAVLRTS